MALSFKLGAAVLNDPLANDLRRNGTHISGTDDDRVLRAPNFSCIEAHIDTSINWEALIVNWLMLKRMCFFVIFIQRFHQ